MNAHHFVSTLVIASCLALGGCNKSDTSSSSSPPEGSPSSVQKAESDSEDRLCSRWISGQEARSIVEGGGLLLDVRTPEEYEQGHLDGATNIPVDELASRLDEVPEDQHVVVYCKSGRRAHRAAGILSDDGRTVSEIGHMGQYAADAPAGCGD